MLRDHQQSPSLCAYCSSDAILRVCLSWAIGEKSFCSEGLALTTSSCNFRASYLVHRLDALAPMHEAQNPSMDMFCIAGLRHPASGFRDMQLSDKR